MNCKIDEFIDNYGWRIVIIYLIFLVIVFVNNEIVKGNNILDYCNSLGYKDYHSDITTGVYCFDGYTMSRTTGNYIANNVYYLNETELKEAKK